MQILADQEGQKTIQALCDIALKSGGIQNLPHINRVLSSVKPLPTEEKPKEVPVPNGTSKNLGGKKK